MLVHFPIAFWSTAAVCDVATLFYPDFRLVEAAYACVAVGVLGGIAAITAGFVEYAAVSRSHPAQGTLSAHMLTMISAWLIFVSSLVLRGVPSARATVSPLALGLDLCGFAALIAGAFLGGKLVYGFGVGAVSGGVSSEGVNSSRRERQR